LDVLAFCQTGLRAPRSTDKVPSVYVTVRLSLSPMAAIELINSLNSILATLSHTPGSGISFAPHPGPGPKAN